MKLRRLLISLVLGLIGGVAAADSPAPPELPDDILDNVHFPQHAQAIASELRLGHLLLRFEDSGLSTIQKTIGVGKISKKGDAADFEEWLCYTVTEGKRPYRLWLLSGEMDGGKLGAASAEYATAAGPASTDCPPLPPAFQPVLLDSTIRLGMTRAALERKLGDKLISKGGYLIYSHTHRLAHDYEETGLLAVKLQDNRVCLLTASKLTSN